MGLQLFLSPRQHFDELVEAGFSRLKIQTYPAVRTYLVDMLEFYLDTRNLFPDEKTEAGQNKPQTMAETWLQIDSLAPHERIESLKQLADRALYVSGFFSESLQRKVVDVDYYADMGGAAYSRLAGCIPQDTSAQVYRTFSSRFLEFADVLAFVSQKSLVQTDESVLRLYDRYLRTGSELARERLNEMGVLTVPTEQAKKARQD